MENENSILSSLIRLVIKWKWHFFIILSVAALSAVVISSPWVIKPKYRSTATVYPVNILPFSEESETEQLLQWMQSRDIMDSMIVRFNLDTHYNVSKNYKQYHNLMEYLFKKNVRINKTNLESVSIEVTDTDPVQACEMVNALIELANQKIKLSLRENAEEEVRSYQALLQVKQAELDTVLKNHQLLRTKYGILEYTNQTREIARGEMGTVDGSNAQLINKREVEKLKASFEEKGGEFLYYHAQVFNILNQMNKIAEDYEVARLRMYQDLSYTNVVSKPIVPDKKVYPIRWLMLAVTLIATTLILLLVIVFIENYPAWVAKVSGLRNNS